MNASLLHATGVPQIEERLRASTESDVERARAAAQHLVLSGGKRVRPRLALLVAEAVGLDETTALTIGTSAELVHAATLLHDDVIDRSDQRRGQITVNAKYGAGSAILTGDFLLAQALSQLLEAELYPATRELSRAVRDLAEAEILQLQQAFQLDTTLEQTRRIAHGKTAALFIWAARAVAVTVGLPAERVAAAGDVGRALGYAFQVADDLLDFTSRSAGKPAQKDLREGQINLPMQLVRAEDSRFAACVARAFETREESDYAAAYLAMPTARAAALAQAEITGALTAAKRGLSELSQSPAVNARFQQFIHECTQRLV
jgi:geranylgeranyl pyrophosphate synthase